MGTDHRCPCRTLGLARSPITVEVAEAALRDGCGRLSADHRIVGKVRISAHRAVHWEDWRRIEAQMLARLASGERVESVLESEPFPPLTIGSWLQIGTDLADGERPMRWARAIQWVGEAIVALQGGAQHRTRPTVRPRPWVDAFDRAARRTPHPEDPEAMLGDWIADAIWSLEWTARGSFALARADFATRVAIARWLAARFEAEGARGDRAMAEAIAITEITSLSETWTEILARVRAPNEPARSP